MDDKMLIKEIKAYSNLAKPRVLAEQFWKLKLNQQKFPVIFYLFKTHHAVPATSTPSERLFSATDYQIWDRRNRLDPQKVEAIMFIYENEDL